MQRLIGLNGRLHSGKDSIFEIIESYSVEPVVRMGFADKLKLSAAAALGYQGVDVEEAVRFCNRLKEHCSIIVANNELSDDPALAAVGFTKEQKVITGREYLQWYGTEAHRQIFGEDFWVDALLPNSDTTRSMYEGKVVVITDVRFENEAVRIRDLGGEIWWIDADERLGPLPKDAHVSEHPLPSLLIDKVVSNNGTLPELDDTVKDVLTYVGSDAT